MQLPTLLTVAATLSLAPTGAFAGRGSYLTVKPSELDKQIAQLEEYLRNPPCKVTIYAPPPKQGQTQLRTVMGFASAGKNEDVPVKIASTGHTYQCRTDATCEEPVCHGLPNGWTYDGVYMHTFTELSLEQLKAQKAAQTSRH